MNITLIKFFGLILTLITVITPLILWLVNSEKRKYGLERDFAHLKRNYEQQAQGLNTIILELDRRFNEIDKTLRELKSQFFK